MQIDYLKCTYIYFNGISDVSKQPDKPEPDFDVQLASDLYANVGLHTWPKYSELQVFGKIETLDSIHSTVYNRVTKFC